MPILPENRDRYPDNWDEIRGEILRRASNRCEFCKAENHSEIWRGEGDDAGTYMDWRCWVYREDNGEWVRWAYKESGPYNKERLVKVVLTIAHLDHQPEHNEPENLRALCQQCHNRYDVQHRQQTRRRRRAIGDLFE